MRSLAMVARACTRQSISSKVFSGDREMRKMPIITLGGSFMAEKTWLGLPLWQAEPEETKIPRSLKARTSISLG